MNDHMPEDEIKSWVFIFLFSLFMTGTIGQFIDVDRQVLLSLKYYLQSKNLVNRGRYAQWNKQNTSSCTWPGIYCNDENRVTTINLSGNNISGPIFGNFSALTELSTLDLSVNTIEGEIPFDLGNCRALKYLNLSHNMIRGDLNLTGLHRLETLDLSVNRFRGQIRSTLCSASPNLVSVNLSSNKFSGDIENCFDGCLNLRDLDMSINYFTGPIWPGFARLGCFSVSHNLLQGPLSAFTFAGNCSLVLFDVSENRFFGNFPAEISNCPEMTLINLWGNKFSGQFPKEIGSMKTLKALYLGNNSFSREIPESLVNCTGLEFLDLSRNGFGGDVQQVFGKFTQLKFLVLHGNSYTGGMISSGILKLPNISRLDLSYNNFSGRLPIEISHMRNLKYLILAYNKFNGTIPPEYGNLTRLQALDLSFNALDGKIPPEIGKIKSLLWLMLANNSLSGNIPPEIGKCSSLLWLNLENNQLSGSIPPELTRIGSNPWPTFESNRGSDLIIAGSGECLAMKRWIPANYPPFSFVYSLLTRKSCRRIWDRVFKGYMLFPMCSAGTELRAYMISGYIQLTGNQFSGKIPTEIGNMKNFSLLHLGLNSLSGKIPPEIGKMTLVVLNLTRNGFSGNIPVEIGCLKCLQNLDLSYNNFSGDFPASLGNLAEINKLNVSYNPYITGKAPFDRQFATFDMESYIGDPLLQLPPFFTNPEPSFKPNRRVNGHRKRKHRRLTGALVFLALTLGFLTCGALYTILSNLFKTPTNPLPQNRPDSVTRLDKNAFTRSDILKATNNFSEDRILGRGGYGTVYRGLLPDGREIAVKKLQRDGAEGEKEFQAEMQVLTRNEMGWPHPNLVRLHGWCLDGAEKLLVYEYIEGGSLEEVVQDKHRLDVKARLDIAIGVARGLVFLHHECYPSVVHRDVKASNVLLDREMNAKVTDFGLARLVEVGDSHVSTMVAGTAGYVAPEYWQTWRATTKGDVYSFGVLVMELATCRRALDGGEECLVEWGRRVSGSNGSVAGVLGSEKMSGLLWVGLKCVEESPQARPNMKEVLTMLVALSNGYALAPH